MSDDAKTYDIIADATEGAWIDEAKYKEMYEASVSDPDAFWGEHGKRIDWIKPFSIVKNTTYEYPDVSIKWFEDGTLNVAANCIDRHLGTRGDQTAKGECIDRFLFPFIGWYRGYSGEAFGPGFGTPVRTNDA